MFSVVESQNISGPESFFVGDLLHQCLDQFGTFIHPLLDLGEFCICAWVNFVFVQSQGMSRSEKVLIFGQKNQILL